MKKILCLCLILSFGIFSCKKEVENPYDSLIYPDSSDTSSYTIEDHSIISLHEKIFSPFCADAGCHDGAFEPDFRTIESTYNTLVYHPIIKNDINNTYEYRVVPNFPSKSVLYARLLADDYGGSLFDPNSQVMPLTADTASGYDPEQVHVWHNDKETYIQNIKDWIDAGALDMLGDTPSLGNFEPEIKGMVAYADGSSIPLIRNGNSLIQVPLGTQNIKIWYSYDDDVTPVQNISNNKAKFSTLAYNFDSANEQSITYTNSPITELGFKNIMVDFYHHITINVGSYVTDQILYNRVYIQDEHNAITEIPSNGTDFSRIRRYAFEFN